MVMQLRPYQLDAVSAVYHHLRHHADNPCMVIPTAGGKTPIGATIINDAVSRWNGRVLMLAHVKELIEQAHEKLQAIAPHLLLQTGIYSAGLKSRDTDKPIIFASIQSVFRRACELGRFDLIIIDEAHMIPPSGEGMYQQFLKEARIVNPNVRIIGLTATPFRMSSGSICGPENILNTICYEVSVRSLIDDGFISQIRSPQTSGIKIDVDNLRRRAGEYVASDVEQVVTGDGVVEAAVRDIIERTAGRRACLIFAASIKHANKVAEEIEKRGHECGFISGETLPFYRAETIERFRSGDLPYLVNVDVLTTGFDAPITDTVALLRPTLSPGLYYQMVGRGFRLHPGKEFCLVLDYANNIIEHGPVDHLQAIPERKGKGGGEKPAKECPNCHEIIAAGFAQCPHCDFIFPAESSDPHDRHASTASVLAETKTETYEVQRVEYCVHKKRGASPDHPKTMRVEYYYGWRDKVSEWVCVEHDGFAGDRACEWWAERSNEPFPRSAEHAVDIASAGGLANCSEVVTQLKPGEEFERIINWQLGDIPPASGADAGYAAFEPDEELEPAAADGYADDAGNTILDDDIPF